MRYIPFTYSFMLAITIGTVGTAVNYFITDTLSPATTIGLMAGWLLTWTAANFSAGKGNTTLLSVVKVLSIICIPLPIVGIGLLLLSLFSVPITVWGIIAFYVVALIPAFYIVKNLMNKLSQPNPHDDNVVDERHVRHAMTGATTGFIVLSLLLMIGIYQPWIEHSEPILWISILGIGQLSFIFSLTVLEKVK